MRPSAADVQNRVHQTSPGVPRVNVRAWLPLVAIAAIGAGACFSLVARNRAASITIDYPEDGSIFPPEITPPAFLWRDSAKTATLWRIDVSFADGSSGIHATSKGEPMRIGKIDPDCVAATNELPKLTPRQAAAHTWIPSPALWTAIKKHSVSGAATVTISGFTSAASAGPVSRGRATIHTSQDPAGAPSSTATCR